MAEASEGSTKLTLEQINQNLGRIEKLLGKVIQAYAKEETIDSRISNEIEEKTQQILESESSEIQEHLEKLIRTFENTQEQLDEMGVTDEKISGILEMLLAKYNVIEGMQCDWGKVVKRAESQEQKLTGEITRVESLIKKAKSVKRKYRIRTIPYRMSRMMKETIESEDGDNEIRREVENEASLKRPGVIYCPPEPVEIQNADPGYLIEQQYATIKREMLALKEEGIEVKGDDDRNFTGSIRLDSGKYARDKIGNSGKNLDINLDVQDYNILLREYTKEYLRKIVGRKIEEIELELRKIEEIGNNLEKQLISSGLNPGQKERIERIRGAIFQIRKIIESLDEKYQTLDQIRKAREEKQGTERLRIYNQKKETAKERFKRAIVGIGALVCGEDRFKEIVDSNVQEEEEVVRVIGEDGKLSKDIRDLIKKEGLWAFLSGETITKLEGKRKELEGELRTTIKIKSKLQLAAGKDRMKKGANIQVFSDQIQQELAYEYYMEGRNPKNVFSKANAWWKSRSKKGIENWKLAYALNEGINSQSAEEIRDGVETGFKKRIATTVAVKPCNPKNDYALTQDEVDRIYEEISLDD